MPERQEETAPRKRSQKRLTLYGQWIARLCAYLETTPTAIARKAGLHPSTIGKVTKTGEHTNAPTRDTIDAICKTMRQVAFDQKKPWREEWETMMVNAAGMATYRQMLEARDGLVSIPVVSKPQKRRKNTTG